MDSAKQPEPSAKAMPGTTSVSAKLVDKLIAWGQYMHWAEQQFQHFKDLSDDASEADKIGAIAHWLASEFVVLEGWRSLDLSNVRVASLLDEYPEHTDLLRRCRNAVYHYQESALHPKLLAMLRDEQEELGWAGALHYELQGALEQIVYELSAGNEEAIEIMGKAIGWFPTHPLAAQIAALRQVAAEANTKIGEDTSVAAHEVRAATDQVLEIIRTTDMFPATSALKRMQRSTKGGPSA